MSNFLLYAASVLIWGSTWLAISFQLGEVAPQVSLVYRLLIASGLLFAWCLLRGHRLRFGLASHAHFLLLGLLLFGLNYAAAYHAQLYISSALNAIAFSAIVWLNIVNARLFLGTRIQWRPSVGALLGAIGIVILFWPEVRTLDFSDRTVLGASLALGGAFIASLGNILAQRAQRSGLPVLQINTWGMLYGAGLSALYAWYEHAPFTVERSWSYLLSLLYLAVFGSIVAFGCYLTLIGRIGAHRAGYAAVMFPVVALCLSALFEGLSIDSHIVAGVVLALAGNVVILSGAARAAATPARAADLEPAGPARGRGGRLH